MAFFDLTIANIFRIIIGLLLAISAILKLPDLKGFAAIVQGYRLLPYKIAKPLAYSQPFVELIIGIWLLTNYQLVYASFFATGALIVATIFIAHALRKKIYLENCGCFGTTVKIPVSWRKLIENIIWVLLSLYVFITSII
jgi:uncharacterized membrane protein YphA (DoxX/SURF4 family)